MNGAGIPTEQSMKQTSYLESGAMITVGTILRVFYPHHIELYEVDGLKKNQSLGYKYFSITVFPIKLSTEAGMRSDVIDGFSNSELEDLYSHGNLHIYNK